MKNVITVPILAIIVLAGLWVSVMYMLSLPIVAFSNTTGECVYIKMATLEEQPCPDILPGKYFKRIVK